MSSRKTAIPQTADTPPANRHPLIGAGLHFKSEEGTVENQAMILDVIPSGSSAVAIWR
jgi:hypothetical protein